MHATLLDVTTAEVSLRYTVRAIPEAWVLTEDKVPESVPHNDAARALELVLLAWAARSPRSLAIARNLAVRWIEQAPRIGIDPDVCVLEPAPPGAGDLSSLCVWKPGCVPPRLCFEIVSANHPHKDYAEIQDRYASMGAEELVVFDPLLVGPARLGGPVPLQLWRRADDGAFERRHFGDAPAASEVLDAWLVPDGRLLRIKDDPESGALWLTGEETMRAEGERERREKEAALARVAELERELRGRG